jgi:Rrf2 family protein
MKITKKSEYALRALVEIGLHNGGRVIRAQDIAEKEKLSVKFLEQVLLPLKNRGILETRRGVAGGYLLNRPPEKITVAEVIRIVDGALAPVGCVSETAYTPCGRNENLCALKTVMAEVRKAIVEVLERTTLADMCQRARELQEKWDKTH